jgi:hypothetical protein
MKMRGLLQVVALTAIALSAMSSPRSADAGSVVYVAGDSNDFGTINLSTGAFTPVGTLNLPSSVIYGMGFGADGKLYGLDSQIPVPPGSNSHLWQIDTATAGVTDMGSVGQTTVGAGSGPDGTMYSLTYPTLTTSFNSSLYTLSPPSTSTSTVGPTLYLPSGLVAVNAGNQVFATALNNSTGSYDLYNVTGGTATDIGPTSDGSGTNFAFTTGVFVGGTLYAFTPTGVDDNGNLIPGAIFTVDTSTGASTFVTDYTMAFAAESIYAAAVGAQGPSVPEPSSVVLGAIALAAGGSLGLLRRRTATAAA